MRYKYKVRELGKEEIQDMEAMSLKKLRSQIISYHQESLEN